MEHYTCSRGREVSSSIFMVVTPMQISIFLTKTKICNRCVQFVGITQIFRSSDRLLEMYEKAGFVINYKLDII